MAKWYLIILSVCILGCKNNHSIPVKKISGATMGTYYIISYYDKEYKIDKNAIDHELILINQELSTYIPSSTISQFNSSKSGINNVKSENGLLEFPLFDEVFRTAKYIYENTNNYFDPTVMPLVNYWGFGYDKRDNNLLVDTIEVRRMLSFVGFDKIKREESIDTIKYSKLNPESQIDFSAIAKGYGVDLLGQLLDKHGINNYLIDIGGEVLAIGTKPNGAKWTLGITKPEEESEVNDLFAAVELQDEAMASSGNYRNFYEINGQKYSHTINPRTGFTERNNLLSTSIIAENCMLADAYATACMVMGLEKAIVLIEELEGIEACFIYNNNGQLEVSYSSGFNK